MIAEKVGFENLVISDKCKTGGSGYGLVQWFENLVISDKCKTFSALQTIADEFENLVISDKCKTILFALVELIGLRTL